MQLWIAVHLPSLCLDVFRPKWSPDTDDGFAVLDHDRVIATDTTARRAGVRSGLRRGGILTLAPNTSIRDRDRELESSAMREVATGLLNLSPQVVIPEEHTWLVDVTASLR